MTTPETPHDPILASVALFAGVQAARCPRRLRGGRSMATWLTLTEAERLGILHDVTAPQRRAQRRDATTKQTRTKYTEDRVYVHDETALARARLAVASAHHDAEQTPTAAVVQCAGGCGRFLPAPSRHRPVTRYCSGKRRQVARPRPTEQPSARGSRKLARPRPTAPACRD